MKKKMPGKVLTAIILFVPFMTYAQKSDSVLVAVQFAAMRRIDTTQLDFKEVRPKILVVSEKQSFYTDYYSYMIDDGRPVMMDIGGGRRTTLAGTNVGGILKTLATNTMQILEAFGRDYYAIESKVPAFDWVVGKDTREIRGIKCQSATLDYKGRHYTAWFADQLPYPVGPWKFGGLPGLILEMYDDKDEVSWTCTQIETGKDFKPLHTDNIVKSADEASIRKLKDALEKDRAAMKGEGITAPAGLSVTGGISAQTLGSGERRRKTPQDNNPIEKK